MKWILIKNKFFNVEWSGWSISEIMHKSSYDDDDFENRSFGLN